jgi:uncharacterized protein YjbJ (UPF0337 family)
MSAFKDRLRGFLNIGGGRLKQAASQDLNRQDLHSEGTSQELLGRGQKFVGDVKDAVGTTVSKAGRKIRRS